MASTRPTHARGTETKHHGKVPSPGVRRLDGKGSPEGNKRRTLARIVKRAAAGVEVAHRSEKQQELLHSVGLALFRQVWRLLGSRDRLRGC